MGTPIFNVGGPLEVTVAPPGDNPAADGSYEPLGLTPHDTLPSFNNAHLNQQIQTSQFGEEPEDVLFLGSTTRLSLTLVKFDRGLLDTISAKPGVAHATALAGQAGQPGVLYSNALLGKEFGLRLNTSFDVVATEFNYEFQRCLLVDDDAVQIIDYGNAVLRAVLDILVLRDAANNLYTEF